MLTVHEDPEVSQRSIVDGDRIGVVYVWLGMDLGIMVHTWGGRVYRWDVGSDAFL